RLVSGRPSPFLEIRQMTMELVGERGSETLNNTGWKMLIDLALRYGWKPAGAREPDADVDGYRDEDDGVERHEALPQACEVPANHPRAGGVRRVSRYPTGQHARRRARPSQLTAAKERGRLLGAPEMTPADQVVPRRTRELAGDPEPGKNADSSPGMHAL